MIFYSILFNFFASVSTFLIKLHHPKWTDTQMKRQTVRLTGVKLNNPSGGIKELITSSLGLYNINKMIQMVITGYDNDITAQVSHAQYLPTVVQNSTLFILFIKTSKNSKEQGKTYIFTYLFFISLMESKSEVQQRHNYGISYQT